MIKRTMAVMTALQQRNARLLHPYGGSAPDRLNINVATLPRAMTVPGQAALAHDTMGSRRHVRRWYRIQVLTGLVQDAGDAKLLQAIELLDVFAAAYLSDDTVSLDVVGFEATIAAADDGRAGSSPRDTGLLIITIGKPYHGFELLVPVDEWWDEE